MSSEQRRERREERESKSRCLRNDVAASLATFSLLLPLFRPSALFPCSQLCPPCSSQIFFCLVSRLDWKIKDDWRIERQRSDEDDRKKGRCQHRGKRKQKNLLRPRPPRLSPPQPTQNPPPPSPSRQARRDQKSRARPEGRPQGRARSRQAGQEAGRGEGQGSPQGRARRGARGDQEGGDGGEGRRQEGGGGHQRRRQR